MTGPILWLFLVNLIAIITLCKSKKPSSFVSSLSLVEAVYLPTDFLLYKGNVYVLSKDLTEDFGRHSLKDFTQTHSSTAFRHPIEEEETDPLAVAVPVDVPLTIPVEMPVDVSLTAPLTAPLTSIESATVNLQSLQKQMDPAEIANLTHLLSSSFTYSAATHSFQLDACLVQNKVTFACRPFRFLFFVLVIFLLILLAGLMAGSTLGLLSINPLDLVMLQYHGKTTSEQNAAKEILCFLQQRHLLLVTLLLLNAVANEALPLFLDKLMCASYSIIFSVTCVVLFGEILPTAMFTSKHQIRISQQLIPVVRFLVNLVYPFAFPISKLLDVVVGHRNDNIPTYTREELKTFLYLISSKENAIAMTAVASSSSKFFVLRGVQRVQHSMSKYTKRMLKRLGDAFQQSSFIATIKNSKSMVCLRIDNQEENEEDDSTKTSISCSSLDEEEEMERWRVIMKNNNDYGQCNSKSKNREHPQFQLKKKGTNSYRRSSSSSSCTSTSADSTSASFTFSSTELYKSSFAQLPMSENEPEMNFQPEEILLLHGILDLHTKSVFQLMKPLSSFDDVYVIQEDIFINQKIRKHIYDKGCSSIAVCSSCTSANQSQILNEENVQDSSLVIQKVIDIRAFIKNPSNDLTLRSFPSVPFLRVSSTQSLYNLFLAFREYRVRLAFVVDNSNNSESIKYIPASDAFHSSEHLSFINVVTYDRIIDEIVQPNDMN